MKIHPCQFQYPIQQSVHSTPSNRQKIPISLVRNEISLFTISSIVTTGERELSSCNIYRKFNHSSREPLPVEIPLLVLLIQQKFRGGQRFFPRYFRDVKKKKKKKKRSRARSCRVLLKSCIFFEREEDARAVVAL